MCPARRVHHGMADDVHDQRQAEQDESGPDRQEPGCLPRNASRGHRDSHEERCIEDRPPRHVLVQPRHVIEGEEHEDAGQHPPGGWVGAVSRDPDRRDGGSDDEGGRGENVRVAPLVRRVEEAVAQVERAEIDQLGHEQGCDRRRAVAASGRDGAAPPVRGARRSGLTPRREYAARAPLGARDDAPICSPRSGSTPRACGRCSTGGTSPSARSPRASSPALNSSALPPSTEGSRARAWSGRPPRRLPPGTSRSAVWLSACEVKGRKNNWRTTAARSSDSASLMQTASAPAANATSRPRGSSRSAGATHLIRGWASRTCSSRRCPPPTRLRVGRHRALRDQEVGPSLEHEAAGVLGLRRPAGDAEVDALEKRLERVQPERMGIRDYRSVAGMRSHDSAAFLSVNLSLTEPSTFGPLSTFRPVFAATNYNRPTTHLFVQPSS